MSLALERFGGIAYAKASESEGRESSVSLFTMGLGVGTLNPYAVPRLGVDYITSSGLSLGGAVGLARWSGSTSSGSRSEDVGSIFLYTLTPRAGYRLPLSERVDLTLRGGVTFAGGSLSNGEDEGSSSLFSVGLGLDAPFAFRVTDSFNLLAGPAFDVMVTGTSSSTTRSGNSTSSSDIKGALWSLQGWLGVGGYL